MNNYILRKYDKDLLLKTFQYLKNEEKYTDEHRILLNNLYMLLRRIDAI